MSATLTSGIRIRTERLLVPLVQKAGIPAGRGGEQKYDVTVETECYKDICYKTHCIPGRYRLLFINATLNSLN